MAVSTGTLGWAGFDMDDIGPDDERGRTSDDALRDAIRDVAQGDATFVGVDHGWTEIVLNPGNSTFLLSDSEPRAVVQVAGDPAVGVWRWQSVTYCASLDG